MALSCAMLNTTREPIPLSNENIILVREVNLLISDVPPEDSGQFGWRVWWLSQVGKRLEGLDNYFQTIEKMALHRKHDIEMHGSQLKLTFDNISVRRNDYHSVYTNSA